MRTMNATTPCPDGRLPKYFNPYPAAKHVISLAAAAVNANYRYCRLLPSAHTCNETRPRRIHLKHRATHDFFFFFISAVQSKYYDNSRFKDALSLMAHFLLLRRDFS